MDQMRMPRFSVVSTCHRKKKTHFEVSRCSGDPKRLRRIKLPEYVDSDDEDLDLPGAVPHNRRGGDDKTKNEKL